MQSVNQLHDEAPILAKTVQLYREFYWDLKTFPKRDQYLLGKRCEDHILAFMELVLLAVGLQRDQKLRALEQASGKFDVLKVLFRVARELKMLDNRRYLSLEERIQEIGRMLGGWVRDLPPIFGPVIM